MKKLYRSDTNRIFAGVLGGIGEYFDVDPVIVRIVYMLIMATTGVIPGILVYIAAIFIVPPQPTSVGK